MEERRRSEREVQFSALEPPAAAEEEDSNAEIAQDKREAPVENLGEVAGKTAFPQFYRDTGFQPVTSERVEARSRSLQTAKWIARGLVLLVLVSILVMLIVFTAVRKASSPDQDVVGSFNSTLMFVSFQGSVEYWNEAMFAFAVSKEAGVSADAVFVWEVWPGSVNVYFQMVGLDTEKLVAKAVSRLASAIGRDFSAGREKAVASAFRDAGLVVISQLLVSVDPEGPKPPVMPPPPTDPTPVQPPFTPPVASVPVEVLTPIQGYTPDIPCGQALSPGRFCEPGLELDEALGRCRCPTGSRTVCYDGVCKGANWTCHTPTSMFMGTCATVTLDSCKRRCEDTSFCVALLHDTRRPANDSCYLIYRKGLDLPWSFSQQAPFHTFCEITGRKIPKKVTAPRYPHLHFNTTSPKLVLSVGESPSEGTLRVVPKGKGLTFAPPTLDFGKGVLQQEFVVAALETVNITGPNGTVAQEFVAAQGTAFQNGAGYKVWITYELEGSAADEYLPIETGYILLSRPGRVWQDEVDIPSSPAGTTVTLNSTLSGSLNESVLVTPVSVPVGDSVPVAFIPPDMVFAPGATSSAVRVIGLLPGSHVITFYGNTTALDISPQTVVTVVPAPATATLYNVATMGNATQSSTPRSCTHCNASSANDGDVSMHTEYIAITDYEQVPADLEPWWEVRLARPVAVASVVLHNRKDCCKDRLFNLTVELYYQGNTTWESPVLNKNNAQRTPTTLRTTVTPLQVADRVRVTKYNHASMGVDGIRATLNLLEVEVLTYDPPETTPGPSPPPKTPVQNASSFSTPVYPPVYEPTADQQLWNVAWAGKTNQSSTVPGCAACGPDTAINHIICPPVGGQDYTMTNALEPNADRSPWLTVTLPHPLWVHSVVIFNRMDCCKERLRDITVSFWWGTEVLWESATQNPEDVQGGPENITVVFDKPYMGTEVKIAKSNPTNIQNVDMVLSVSEVEIYAFTALDSSVISAPFYPPQATQTHTPTRRYSPTSTIPSQTKVVSVTTTQTLPP